MLLIILKGKNGLTVGAFGGLPLCQEKSAKNKDDFTINIPNTDDSFMFIFDGDNYEFFQQNSS